MLKGEEMILDLEILKDQNLVIKTKSNAKFCEVEIECQSIVSAGYTPSYDMFGLPTFVPINLVN